MEDISPTLEQSYAVEACPPGGTVVTAAAPGSGKTRTLVWRILRDIERGILPERMTAITFTGAAAGELRKRLDAHGVALGFVGTLHSFCLRMIQAHTTTRTVLDQDSSDEVMRYAMARTAADVPLSSLKAWLYERKLPKDKGDKVMQVACTYCAILKQYDAIDYGLILTGALMLLEEGFDPCVDALYVDEFQDSGPTDLRIYDAIKARVKFYCGDPDQSIYEFRGARPANLLEVIARPGTVLARLETNFRSLRIICECADALIAYNSKRVAKVMRSSRSTELLSPAGRVAFEAHDTHLQEAAAIVSAVKASPDTWDATAVLCRYNHDRKAIAQALKAAGVTVNGYFEQDLPPDWRRALALLNCLAHPENVFAYATRASIDGIPFGEALAEAIQKRTAGKPLRALNFEVVTMAHAMHFLLANGVSTATRQMIYDAAEKAGIDSFAALVMNLRTDGAAAPQRVQGGVDVLTYHGAKGLEWDTVYLPAVEAKSIAKKDPGELEEERRCFFVGLTRARNEARISWAHSRYSEFTGRVEATGGASRFIDEARAIAL